LQCWKPTICLLQVLPPVPAMQEEGLCPSTSGLRAGQGQGLKPAGCPVKKRFSKRRQEHGLLACIALHWQTTGPPGCSLQRAACSTLGKLQLRPARISACSSPRCSPSYPRQVLSGYLLLPGALGDQGPDQGRIPGRCKGRGCVQECWDSYAENMRSRDRTTKKRPWTEPRPRPFVGLKWAGGAGERISGPVLDFSKPGSPHRCTVASDHGLLHGHQGRAHPGCTLVKWHPPSSSAV